MIDFSLNFATISLDSKIIDYPKFSYINNIMLSYLIWRLILNPKKKKFDELINTKVREKHDFEK